jgi:hypothetical protein
MILLSSAMLANGMAMEDQSDGKESLGKQYSMKIEKLQEKQTDEDRLVLLSMLKSSDALDMYLKYNGNVADIPSYLTVYVWRIDKAFEGYYKYLGEKYD